MTNINLTPQVNAIMNKSSKPWPSKSPSLTNVIHEIEQEHKQNDDIMRILQNIGFNDGKKLSDSLQGMIWKAQKVNKFGATEKSVIKITNKFLHENSTAIIKNALYRVAENILSEQSILKYLTQSKNCPNSIIKFQGFFQTKTDYWLAMEDGGTSLFQFAVKSHELIGSKKLYISEWRKLVLVILKQMIECIEYIHSKNVIHFDISLENFVINDVQIEVQCDTDHGNIDTIKFLTDDIQIKLCDFGLAQKFTKSHFMSNKFCGKDNYKSPEVFNNKNAFDAKKNDIWCLGISIFILLTGVCPWDIAHESDPLFSFVFNNSVYQLLQHWNIQHYVGRDLMFLLESIFKYENDRINLDDFKKYFCQFVDMV